jgi:hypothetical protein
MEEYLRESRTSSKGRQFKMYTSDPNIIKLIDQALTEEVLKYKKDIVKHPRKEFKFNKKED